MFWKILQHVFNRKNDLFVFLLATKCQSNTSMDVLAFPPEVLALALSQTDAESVHSLMCASRATCQFVRSFRDQIYLENRLQKFIDNLPCITGAQNLCQEENVCVFNNDFTCTDHTQNTTQHALYGKGSLIFRRDNVRYISIRCPVQAKLFNLCVGGQQILKFDQTLMHLFDVDDGYFDIMSFMKNLPDVYYHDIRIDYDTGDAAMAMFTTTCSFPHNLQHRISWKVTQPDLVFENSIHLTSTCRLWSNHISLGHIIVIQQDGILFTDLVKTFTVKIDMTKLQVPAAATRSDSVADRLFNGPVKLQECYYLQMSEKVNCSKVDNLTLLIEFYKPVTATIKIYNLHTNFARTHYGMLGLAFAS